MEVKFVEREHLKEKPDMSTVKFGSTFTDYMLTATYDKENGWHDYTIEPYGPIEISPSAVVLHYAQTVFEGLKAYDVNGETVLFRPEENFKRLNNSLERMSMAKINEEEALHALKELLKIEKDWVPTGEGQSLYIRPFVFGDDTTIGVHPSTTYKFMIILSPVGGLFSAGTMGTTKIYVEDKFVRAVRGGVGEAKTGGNYAASMKAQEVAHELGYDQVLWLDGVEQEYLEEVGAMNIFFVQNGELYTPKLNGSILPGITRKSIIEFAKDAGYTVHEERIPLADLDAGLNDGTITEVFGAGTAAVVAPVGELNIRGDKYTVGDGNVGPVAQEIYDTLTGIQNGLVKDTFGWIEKVED